MASAPPKIDLLVLALVNVDEVLPFHQLFGSALFHVPLPEPLVVPVKAGERIVPKTGTTFFATGDGNHGFKVVETTPG